ncbi:ABC transporter permease [Tsukamurella asaccharolytica]|uniref:ABC transporter permease n=1 Tax=Tsukamurella asaccharolytica TaxID=2592067 RepID=A0A5C5R8G5_9ACTN|nr:ABC transporter permease [Tsukamurella asaccharolytica]TWS18355.1 ABC transporter permease [Tsukamurella asaccharolytica]
MTSVDVAAPAGEPTITPGLVPEEPGDRDRRTARPPLWRALVTGPGLIGTVLVGIVLVAGLLGPLLTAYGPTQQIDGAYLLGPSASHPFGTDDVNRDVLTRVLHGIRIDLLIAFTAVPIGAVLGALVGLVAVSHPVTDVIAQRAFDVILAFPALILGIALTAILSPGAVTIAIIITVAEIPIFGRLVRTAVLSVRELPYVEAATVSGASTTRILGRHVLPNSIDALIVQVALSLSLAVFIESGLSFLGIGIPAPAPSLGSILAAGNGYLESNPWISIAPLLAITALVLGFALIAQSFSRARRNA